MGVPRPVAVTSGPGESRSWAATVYLMMLAPLAEGWAKKTRADWSPAVAVTDAGASGADRTTNSPDWLTCESPPPLVAVTVTK